MAQYETILTQLQHNLNILRERQAKYAGKEPLDLLNQIDDHIAAITVTGQARAGDLSQLDWLTALQPLLISSGQIHLATLLVLLQSPGEALLPDLAQAARPLTHFTCNHLRQTPKDELIAIEFKQNRKRSRL